MQGRRGRTDPFSGFGDPFGGFGSFSGFGDHRSLLSSFFGGRDPFDDPFFTRPFGGMFESSFFGPSGSSFGGMHPAAYIEDQVPEPKRSRGPIIEELDSDDEKKEEANIEKNENPRKHGRLSNGPYVEDPDDEDEERRKNKHLPYRNDYNMFNNMPSQPQAHSFTFQTSTVSYGGANGAYYTSSNMRRTGSDGLTVEERREADSATRKATHRVSRGLHNKGHTLERKLNSDGKVESMQTLHNLNEDELSGFEEAWRGSAKRHMPGWNGNFIGLDNMGTSSSGQNVQARRGGWALPSSEHSQHLERVVPGMRGGAESSRPQQATRRRGSSDVRDQSGHSGWKARN